MQSSFIERLSENVARHRKSRLEFGSEFGPSAHPRPVLNASRSGETSTYHRPVRRDEFEYGQGPRTSGPETGIYESGDSDGVAHAVHRRRPRRTRPLRRRRKRVLERDRGRRPEDANSGPPPPTQGWSGFLMAVLIGGFAGAILTRARQTLRRFQKEVWSPDLSDMQSVEILLDDHKSEGLPDPTVVFACPADQLETRYGPRIASYELLRRHRERQPAEPQSDSIPESPGSSPTEQD